MRGDHSREIPAVIVIQLGKFWCFFFLVTYGRWLPMRGLVPREGLTAVLFILYHYMKIKNKE